MDSCPAKKCILGVWWWGEAVVAATAIIIDRELTVVEKVGEPGPRAAPYPYRLEQ
jgi:hypothetical protein